MSKILLDRFRDADATIAGDHLTIRFPLMQIVGLGAVAAGVIFSVWMSTRDLSLNVVAQTEAISSLDASVVDLHDAIHEIDKRSAINGDRIQQHHGRARQ